MVNSFDLYFGSLRKNVLRFSAELYRQTQVFVAQVHETVTHTSSTACLVYHTFPSVASVPVNTAHHPL